MVNQVALIFGYGPRVGFDVARMLETQGFKVAVVSRSQTHQDSNAAKYLKIQADLSDPSSVEKVFTQVIGQVGHPSVVVYNATTLSLNHSDPLENQIKSFQHDVNVNVTSAFAAAHLAIKSFATLPKDSSKTFIYTGNKLPFMVVRPLLTQGVSKAGAAHLIHYLAEQYKEESYQFYFADERKADGDPVYSEIDGPAHAEFYSQLVKQESQGPWNATFVKGTGYVKFSEDMIHEAAIMSLE